MAKKKVLILGGAGFIGSYVNKLLADSGYETIVFDNLSQGRKEMICRGTFIQGDIGNSADLAKVFSNNSIDVVMHFAALIDVGESMTDPASYYKNNICCNLTLLESMRQFGVNKIIFSSSAGVYGIPKNIPILEDEPCHPINPYGETKLVVEHILRSYDLAYGMKSCSLRYFNAAGGDPSGEIKNTKPKENNLIPLVLRSLKLADGKLIINGTDYPTPDGTCVRDYVHIHDLATAHISAMEKLLEGGNTNFYNLGSGKGYSIREVIAAAESVTGKKVPVSDGPRRPGDPPVLIASINKVNRELNWKPSYGLNSMIEHAWKAMN